jgi:hypothetical protein
MPQYHISDAKYLAVIRKNQYRHQIPALALLVLSFLIKFALPAFNLRYPALGLAFLAMIWYMYIGACFRYKQRIQVYEVETLLSPITGRVRVLKSSSDLSYLKVTKHALDIVEIRSPHSSAEWDENNLKLNYRGHNLIFRLDGKEIIRFEDASMEAGNLIGMFIGAGSYSLSLPKPLEFDLNVKDICEAGTTALLAE